MHRYRKLVVLPLMLCAMAANPGSALAVDNSETHKTLVLNIGSMWGSKTSPDGSKLAIQGPDKRIRIWSTESNALLATLDGHTDNVPAVAFSADSTQVISGSWDKTALVWNLAEARIEHKLVGHAGSVQGVAFHPDSQRVVTVSDDKTAKVWSLATGKPLLTLRGGKSPFSALAISPDGKVLVTGEDHPEFIVRAWDLETGKQLARMSGHTSYVGQLHFDAHGSRLATAGGDGEIRIWDAKTFVLLRILPAYRDRNDAPVGVAGIAFHPDGKRLISLAAGNGPLRFWDLASGQHASSAQIDGIVLEGKTLGTLPHHALSLSADGSLLTIGTERSTVVTGFCDVFKQEDCPQAATAKAARAAAPNERPTGQCLRAQTSSLALGAEGSTDFYGQCGDTNLAMNGIVVVRYKGVVVDIGCLVNGKPTEKSSTVAFESCEKYWPQLPDYCLQGDYRGQCKNGQPHGVGFRTGQRGGSKPTMGSGFMGALASAFAQTTNYTIYIESGMFRNGKLQGYGTAKSASGCGMAGCSGERVNDIGWFKDGIKAFDCASYADCIPKLSGKDLSNERQAWLSASAAAGSAAGSDPTKTFEAALSAYQAKGNKDDLKRAQALAASPAERARLEYTLMQLAGFDKVLTLSSRVEGSGKSAGTEDAERLLGFFRSVSSSVPVKFSWSLAPETALLPLKQGRYAVTLKVGLKVDKTHRTCLGAACSDRVGTVPYVREVQVVLDTTNGYRAKGSFELSLDGARTSALFGTESGEAISGFAGVASIESVKLLP